MVNYDLPWNPNRIEQRFGRIHRIGQTFLVTCGTCLLSAQERATCSTSCLKDRRASAQFDDQVYDVLGDRLINTTLQTFSSKRTEDEEAERDRIMDQVITTTLAVI